MCGGAGRMMRTNSCPLLTSAFPWAVQVHLVFGFCLDSPAAERDIRSERGAGGKPELADRVWADAIHPGVKGREEDGEWGSRHWCQTLEFTAFWRRWAHKIERLGSRSWNKIDNSQIKPWVLLMKVWIVFRYLEWKKLCLSNKQRHASCQLPG